MAKNQPSTNDILAALPEISEEVSLEILERLAAGEGVVSKKEIAFLKANRAEKAKWLAEHQDRLALSSQAKKAGTSQRQKFAA